MRKIEREMIRAVHTLTPWSSGNTMVKPHSQGCTVYLHGHPIAEVGFDCMPWVNYHTLEQWPTRTTMSRLRALGVDIYQRNHAVFINGKEVA